MARKKVPIQPTLSTWQDVDDAMKEILNCEGCVDEIEVNLNREITLAKEKADAASKPMRERISELEVQIRDFVSRHREELDGKSKRLNLGRPVLDSVPSWWYPRPNPPTLSPVSGATAWSTASPPRRVSTRTCCGNTR